MKKLLLFATITLIALSACNRDDGSNISGDLLRLDGANFSSPSLPAGTYEHAVRFNANVTGLYEGDLLTGIQVHFYDLPSSDVEIIVYGPGTATTPGPVVYSGIVSGLQPNAINNIEFESGDFITIGRSDLWLSIGYTIQSATQVIGCDAGPRDPNGDFLLDNIGWTTFQDFTGSESINWNIRGIVER